MKYLLMLICFLASCSPQTDIKPTLPIGSPGAGNGNVTDIQDTSWVIILIIAITGVMIINGFYKLMTWFIHVNMKRRENEAQRTYKS